MFYYFHIGAWGYTLCISLLNRINNVGPIVDPCGTPETTGIYDENPLPMTTRCDLFF